MKRSYIREILDSVDNKTISFAGGLPDESLFPIEQIKEVSNKVLENPMSLQYSKSQGDENLREKIAKMYSQKLGFPTSKDEILITTGSQQAFDIISKIFIEKEVLVQTPSYIGALNSFKILGLKLKGFDNLYSLNQHLKANSTLYCMSDFSNPTTKFYDEEQRVEIAHILKRKESFLIEDAAYCFLDFEGKLSKPISALYSKSFHLGSFSKILSPGLRVGWIRARKDFIEKILISKEALDLHTATLNQMLINEYLENYDLEEHLSLIRQNYKSKMRFMSKCLKKYLPSYSFEEPRGGMFIYGEFQEDSFKLAKKALEKNVAFVPASVFYHDNRKSKEARFNFTNSSYEEIAEGIKIISSLLTQKKESIWFRTFKKRIIA